MSDYRTTCPHCGAKLEATVARFLSDVALDEEGRVCGYRVADLNDPDGYAWDHEATSVYCAEHCGEVDWDLPVYATCARAAGSLDLTLQQFATLERALLTAVVHTKDRDELRRLKDMHGFLWRALGG